MALNELNDKLICEKHIRTRKCECCGEIKSVEYGFRDRSKRIAEVCIQCELLFGKAPRPSGGRTTPKSEIHRQVQPPREFPRGEPIKRCPRCGAGIWSEWADICHSCAVRQEVEPERIAAARKEQARRRVGFNPHLNKDLRIDFRDMVRK